MKTNKALGYWSFNGIDALFLIDINGDKVYTERSNGGRGAWSTIDIDRHGREYFCRIGNRFYMDELMTIA